MVILVYLVFWAMLLSTWFVGVRGPRVVVKGCGCDCDFF